MKHNNPATLWNVMLPVDSSHWHWGGYQIYDSTKGIFVDAPEADQKILRDYPYWIDKGPLHDSTRLTITTAKSEYKTGEPVRVGHIVEEIRSGRTLYIMGPKKVTDEFVDDHLKTISAISGDQYPWLPSEYDGEIQNSPGIDYNFEITEYKFDQPGIYRIQWKPGKFASNTLTITVTK